MAEERTSNQERTESPTPKRRQEAREEGKVARSQEVSAAAVLLSGAALLAAAGGTALAAFAVRLFGDSARALATPELGAAGAVTLIRSTIIGLLLALVPFAGGVSAIAIFANLLQTRGTLSWKLVTPQWSHLSPLAGFKRLVGVESLFQLGKSLLKLAVLTLVTWLVLKQTLPDLLALADSDAGVMGLVLRSSLVRLAMVTGLAFLIVALADYAFRWYRTEQSLRMTRQEIIREHRESEGDPLIKARIRSIAQARARRRMFQHVPSADVVIVNPTEIAIALKYDADKSPAPVVVAMGQRKIAERIRELARKSGVPIIENRPVARALLATAKVGRAIPPALYVAVAEILAFVYRRRGGAPRAERSMS